SALKATDAFLRIGRHDVPAAVLLDVVDFAVGKDGRGEIDRAERNLAADLRAVLGIQDKQLARIVGAIELVIDLEDRTFAVGDFELLPDFGRLRHVAHAGCVDSHDGANLRARDVLFAVSRVNDVAINRRRDIQPAPRKLIFPYEFAGSRLQGIKPAV